jgi:hypothetical protein
MLWPRCQQYLYLSQHLFAEIKFSDVFLHDFGLIRMGNDQTAVVHGSG